MSVHYEYRTLWCHKNMDVWTGRLSKELQLWIINVLRWVAGGEESNTLKKRDEAGSHQADKNVLVGHSLTVCLIWEAFPRRHSDTGKTLCSGRHALWASRPGKVWHEARTVRLHPHKRDDTDVRVQKVTAAPSASLHLYSNNKHPPHSGPLKQIQDQTLIQVKVEKNTHPQSSAPLTLHPCFREKTFSTTPPPPLSLNLRVFPVSSLMFLSADGERALLISQILNCLWNSSVTMETASGVCRCLANHQLTQESHRHVSSAQSQLHHRAPPIFSFPVPDLGWWSWVMWLASQWGAID